MRPILWTILPTIGFMLVTAQPCAAAPLESALFSLGPPTLTGNKVSFDVTATFTATGAHSTYKAWSLELDVTKSSAALLGIPPGKTANFAAFSFQPDTTVLNSWVPGIANAPSLGFFEYEDPTASTKTVTTAHGLASSATPYHLGTLVYDLSVLPIATSASLNASILGSGTGTTASTYLWDQAPAGPNTAIQAFTSFTTSAQAFPAQGSGGGGGGSGGGTGSGGGSATVPEPSSLLLSVLGGLGLLLARRRSAQKVQANRSVTGLPLPSRVA
jgi:hypothetical protein